MNSIKAKARERPGQMVVDFERLFVMNDEDEDIVMKDGDVIYIGRSSPFLRVPQIGWNNIRYRPDSPLFRGLPDSPDFYFVHSYYPQPSDPDVIVTTTEYGVRFPSLVAKKNLFATQFHPEKSSITGLTILKNFVRIVKR